MRVVGDINRRISGIIETIGREWEIKGGDQKKGEGGPVT